MRQRPKLFGAVSLCKGGQLVEQLSTCFHTFESRGATLEMSQSTTACEATPHQTECSLKFRLVRVTVVYRKWDFPMLARWRMEEVPPGCEATPQQTRPSILQTSYHRFLLGSGLHRALMSWSYIEIRDGDGPTGIVRQSPSNRLRGPTSPFYPTVRGISGMPCIWATPIQPWLQDPGGTHHGVWHSD